MKRTCWVLYLLLCGCGGTAVQSNSVAPQSYKNKEAETIFMGDSITSGWPLSDYISDTINSGIGGQTSVEMLARFKTDVLDKHPYMVVILAGTNDIRLLPNPNLDSIQAMASMASSAGIRVVLSELLPINNTLDSIYTDPAVENQAIISFNSQLLSMAVAYGYPVAHYYEVFVLPDGSQNASLFLDGIHPNKAGYNAMWKVLQPLLQ